MPEGVDPQEHKTPAERVSIFQPSQYVAYFKRPGLASLFLQFLCFAFSFSTFFAGFALFAQSRLGYGPTQVGHVLLAIGVLGIIMQGRVLGILVNKLGEPRVASGGFLLSGLGGFAVSLTANTPSMMASAGTLSIGSGMVRAPVTSLITRRAGRHEQGVVLGMTQSLQSIAQIISPPVATGLIGMGLLNVWAFVAGAFMLIGMFLSLRNPVDSKA